MEPRPAKTSMLTVSILVVLALLIAYPLSMGPLVRYYGHVWVGDQRDPTCIYVAMHKESQAPLVNSSLIATFYAPLFYIYERSGLAEDVVNAYLKLWDVTLIELARDGPP
ncbi:MAG: hypothetical protein ACAI35_13350 [Candidatus Methylacidiphilales bacterium]|nr:hypothetical protein [Candidatus Methylacidiphilales bacterium]